MTQRDVKQQKLEQQLNITNNKDITALVDGEFDLIYADPPWRYAFSKSGSRDIENQYPTMTVSDICALPVNNIAKKDCVLYLWGTSPKLVEAMKVIDAWGFTYKTCAIWDKQKMGMGYYFRQQHELLLIATKGSPKAPEPSTRTRSIFSYPRTKHSRKPIEMYALLETMYPNKDKIELFCRTPQKGWSVWGNQSGE